MRVIEQLVQHFWARGAITRDEALYLARHGFVKETDLPGLVEPHPDADPEDYPRARPHRSAAEEDRAREAERLEAELAGRQGGGKKGGRKKKPSGHNVGPAVAALGGFFATREPYPALLELAAGLRPRPTWPEAARVIAAADPADLEVALVGLLNARPRALGELWYWFAIEELFDWVEHEDNAGPVADALAKLMRTGTRTLVGRAGQLMKAAEIRALADLLDARRKFLGLLPVLYDRHFAGLGRWLVPPAGAAADAWPALPWAFVIVYNARRGTADAPPPGYPLSLGQIDFGGFRWALGTAVQVDPVAVRELLIHQLRDRPDPRPDRDHWERNLVLDRPLYCPYPWRV